MIAALRDDGWFSSFYIFGACAARLGVKLAPEGDEGAAAAAEGAPPAAAKALDEPKAVPEPAQLVIRAVPAS